MPKTEPIKRDPWAGWRGMVLEAKARLGLTLEEITARLHCRIEEKTYSPSRQMVSRWIKNPDSMPLWAFARINRILEIEADKAREVCVVWR